MSPVRALLPLALATCINIIGLGIMIPLLPFYAKSLGGSDLDAAVIFSVFSACSFLAAPLWGRLSDRLGRKPVMIISVIGTVASYIWLSQAHVLWELFASRALAGATAGWLATSQAYVADVTSGRDRAKGMGLLGAAFGIGFTIGPGIGSVAVGDHAYMIPALLSAGCATLGLIVTVLMVKEPERHRASATVTLTPGIGILADPVLRKLLLPYFLVSLVFTGIEGIFALWCLHELDLGPREVGMFLVFAGLINAFIQGGAVGRMSEKMGEVRVAMIAVIALGVAFASFILIDNLWLVLIPMAGLAIGMGLHNPAMQALMSRVAHHERKGSVLGVAQSAASLSRIAGPAWAGYLFEHYGRNVPFEAAIVVLIVVMVLLFGLVRRQEALGLTVQE